MFGHRYEICFAGREYVAWEDLDGMIGAVEVMIEPPGCVLVEQRLIWKRGQPVKSEIRNIVKAMGVTRLMPRSKPSKSGTHQ